MPLKDVVFIFRIEKSAEPSTEQFLSAILCAKESIESVLDKDAINVNVTGNAIMIGPKVKNQPIEMSLDDCSDKIKGCFCDSSGELYPEFSKITPLMEAPGQWLAQGLSVSR